MSESKRPQFFSWRQAVLESQLPPQSRHILLTLACYMDIRGEGCFPSVDRMVRETGYARATVIKYLNLAIEGGWVKRERHGYGDRRWKRSEYRMSWPLPTSTQADGGSSDELPQGNEPVHDVDHLKNYGGSRHEPPSAWGGSPGDSGVVHHVNSNTPENTPHRTEPARADASNEQATHVPATVAEWGNHLMHHYGYAMSEVMSVSAMGLFRDWVQRRLPTWLVDDAIAAAHAKNGGRPGQPAYYRNFVNQMATELEAAQRALTSALAANFSRPIKGQGGSDAGTDSERDQPGVAGFYADFGRD